jgi:hypothetical protein
MSQVLRKEFVPKTERSSWCCCVAPWSCFNYTLLLEDAEQVRNRMNRWIVKTGARVISIQEHDYLYDNIAAPNHVLVVFYHAKNEGPVRDLQMEE